MFGASYTANLMRVCCCYRQASDSSSVCVEAVRVEGSPVFFLGRIVEDAARMFFCCLLCCS